MESMKQLPNTGYWHGLLTRLYYPMKMYLNRVLTLISVVVLLAQCSQQVDSYHDIAVYPSLENRKANGDLYTPSTQSLLRTHSTLENVNELDFSVNSDNYGTFKLEDKESGKYVEMKNIPMEYLVPRLHYHPSEPADKFDALNLMLAEFSRNSVSVPVGADGDKMAHYETNLSERVPWKLDGDFDFTPNPDYRPLRMSVVNNCLKSGLWELNAVDRSGEVYHSWFNMPMDYYKNLVSKVNNLEPDFVESALVWKEDESMLKLERLRHVKKELGIVRAGLKDESVGFSSQGSRRKLSRNFAMVNSADGGLVKPQFISDFHKETTSLSSFIEPGIYTVEDSSRTNFDLKFLSKAKNVEIKTVIPQTQYNWYDRSPKSAETEKTYLEFIINLESDESIIIGNLPEYLLVQQEDYVIHGFGVGILSPAGFAERRYFLIEDGPCPSYAYLAKKKNGQYFGLNSHGRGIEQIFIRSHPNSVSPHWEVTITSYERIADLVKYIIPMPSELIHEQDKTTKEYTSPIYFTYRDDNKN